MARFAPPPTLHPPPSPAGPRLPTGQPEADRHLSGGLKPHALHELAPATPAASAAAAAFAARLAARAAGTCGHVLWCRPPARPAPFPPGLAGLGLDPARTLFAEAPEPTQRLMALEEAAPAFAAVVAELDLPPALRMLASRRLQLLAERTRALVLWLARTPCDSPSAAETRWRIAPEPCALPALRPLFPGPGGVGLGPRRLRLELVRARGLPAGYCWILEMADDATLPPAAGAVAAALADRSPEACGTPGRSAAAA
ncbi:MAG: hypothetical protein RMK78_03795 [Thermaurantiacus sp.]|uniref:hypothetical protein n=1 Tax=Thermaurantiacus sp. TaxID=2820283 RepID=UPI00298F0027|nr:hypothetical protein [Thermaurantiacus sp.]MDW8414578.1 hypothetical protein [Thermaurantiacus sp.]